MKWIIFLTLVVISNCNQEVKVLLTNLEEEVTGIVDYASGTLRITDATESELCREEILSCDNLKKTDSELKEVENFSYMAVFVNDDTMRRLFDVTIHSYAAEELSLRFKNYEEVNVNKNVSWVAIQVDAYPSTKILAIMNQGKMSLQIKKYYAPEGMWNSISIEKLFTAMGKCKLLRIAEGHSQSVRMGWYTFAILAWTAKPQSIEVSKMELQK